MYRCNKDLDISGTILRNTTARIDMRILFPTRSIRNESYAFLETSQRQATCTPRKYSQLDYQFIPLRHGVKFRSFINSKLSSNLIEESVISDLSVSFITWNIQRFSKNRKRLLVETKWKEKRFPSSSFILSLSPLLFPPFVSSSIRQIIVPPLLRNIMIYFSKEYLDAHPPVCIRLGWNCLAKWLTNILQ